MVLWLLGFRAPFTLCSLTPLLARRSHLMETGKAIFSTGTIDLRHVDTDLAGGVHLLPCCIRQDGPCPVSHYFKPKTTGVEIDGMKVEEAFFRGRRLQGASISVPEGYIGYVLEKDLGNDKDFENTEGDSNHWETRATFGSLTYWNHDDVPSHDDAIVRSLHWLTVANALHQPVSAEDLTNSISKN